MKVCVECGKNLGILEGYRHPILGQKYLLCSKCFDIVFNSVERYRQLVSPYVCFFKKESSTMNDLQKLGENLSKNIKHAQSRLHNPWSHNSKQQVQSDVTFVHYNMRTDSG